MRIVCGFFRAPKSVLSLPCRLLLPPPHLHRSYGNFTPDPVIRLFLTSTSDECENSNFFDRKRKMATVESWWKAVKSSTKNWGGLWIGETALINMKLYGHVNGELSYLTGRGGNLCLEVVYKLQVSYGMIELMLLVEKRRAVAELNLILKMLRGLLDVCSITFLTYSDSVCLVCHLVRLHAI